jgi:5-methylcytosine-specific restriction enzyme A
VKPLRLRVGGRTRGCRLHQPWASVDRTLHFNSACSTGYDLNLVYPKVGRGRGNKGPAPPYLGRKGNWKPEFPDASSKTDGWIGFTPRKDDLSSRTSLQNTIMKQVGNGYVLEYVRLTEPKVNAGGRPLIEQERDQWERAKGALTAAYRITGDAEHTRDMLGTKEYDDIQDRWDEHGDRRRWSVAFFITEAWSIVGWPKARDILGPNVAHDKCEQMSGYIKPLDDEDRAKLEYLEITPVSLPADGLAARYYLRRAQQDNLREHGNESALLPSDCPLYEDFFAIEGLSKEARIRLTLRDRHLVRELKDRWPLKCSACNYDPAERGATKKKAMAILEAHHKLPLQAGERLSTLADLVLLCPTCHQEVHQGLRTL